MREIADIRKRINGGMNVNADARVSIHTPIVSFENLAGHFEHHVSELGTIARFECNLGPGCYVRFVLSNPVIAYQGNLIIVTSSDLSTAPIAIN